METNDPDYAYEYLTMPENVFDIFKTIRRLESKASGYKRCYDPIITENNWEVLIGCSIYVHWCAYHFSNWNEIRFFVLAISCQHILLCCLYIIAVQGVSYVQNFKYCGYIILILCVILQWNYDSKCLEL